MTKLNRWRRPIVGALRRRRAPLSSLAYLSPYSSVQTLSIESLESRRLLAVGDELVTIRLETTDLSGTPIAQVEVGDQFQLRAYVEDPNAPESTNGVFAAYFDVTYDELLASVTGAITYGPSFPNVQQGNTATDGLIDEVGATNGGTQLGAGEFLLFTATLTAESVGTLDFLSDPADVLPAGKVLVSGGNPAGVPPEDIFYGSTSITVFEQPTISVSDEIDFEGSAVLFVVTLSNASPETVTVDVQTEDITAVGGSDYVTRSDTLTFAPGNMSINVLVTLSQDTLDEALETFRLRLSNATNATIADDEGIGSIEDDDDSPSVSIEGVTVTEGNAGTTEAVFNVTLSEASGQTITVDFATADQSALAGSDYTSNTGTVTFLPGEISQTITVLVTGDTASEPNETFSVELLNPVNVILDVAEATGTIEDDDAIGISIDDAQLVEGNAGTTNMSFTVRLTRASATAITVTATASPLTASADEDYEPTSQQITFQPGQTEQTFLVPIVGDLNRELDETLEVTLSAPTGGEILDGTAVGTIEDDDPVPTISIDDVSTLDNVVGTVDLVFTVTLSNPSADEITVDFATLGDTAESDVDFTAATGTVTFAPGETEKTITISIIGDDLDEPDEQFFVDLSEPVNATIDDGRGVGTLLEIPPQLSIDDVSVVEGDFGTVDLVFTVSLSEEVDGVVTVDFATAPGTAEAGVDYESLTGTVTFEANELTQTITIKILGDLSNEFAETLLVNLSNPVGATLGDAQGQGTINDNDDVPLISVEPVSQAEGNAGTTAFQFLVSLNVASGKTVMVDFATADETALAGVDYTALNTTLTFEPGQVSQLVTVEVIGDTLFEPDETFLVTLTNPVNAGLEDPGEFAVGTILNDEAEPTISIDDAEIAEGDDGLTALEFTVRLSHPSTETITVAYTTTSGTATADGDYETISGEVTFEPGETEKPITVQIIGDTMDEPDETFLVTLNEPTNSTIGDGEATGTILDDDGPVAISISDGSLVEGNDGTTNLVFTVTLSRSTEQTVTVQFTTSDGTATGGQDYLASAGTVTFQSMQTTQTLVVPIVGDLLDEIDETFTVILSTPTNAELDVATATGTILDDDEAPSVSIADAITTEGDSGTRQLQFKVTLSAASGQTVSVDYSALAGTAAIGIDFDAAGGTVTFQPGEVEKLVSVAVIGDSIDEDDEDFFVDLANPVNVQIADNRGVGNILDDDRSPSLAITNALVTEGDSGTQTLTFVVLLSEPSARVVTVQYVTADNTATLADGDYQATSGTLTFQPGETQKLVQVTVFGDEQEEPDETLFVNLSNPENAVFDTLLLGSPQGTGVIVSDDLPFVVGSLSGYVYNDSDGNGQRGGSEKLLTGVRIVLTGTDILGQSVTQTAYTNKDDGSYYFGNLVPGTYTITEPDQPSKYDDGIDAAGSLGILGDPQNDRFVVNLGSNQHGTDYNFGERLKTTYISRTFFMASTPDPHPISEVNPPQSNAIPQSQLLAVHSHERVSNATDQAFAEIGTLSGTPSDALLRLIGVGMSKPIKPQDNSLFDPFGDVDLG